MIEFWLIWELVAAPFVLYGLGRIMRGFWAGPWLTRSPTTCYVKGCWACKDDAMRRLGTLSRKPEWRDFPLWDVWITPRAGFNDLEPPRPIQRSVCERHLEARMTKAASVYWTAEGTPEERLVKARDAVDALFREPPRPPRTPAPRRVTAQQALEDARRAHEAAIRGEVPFSVFDDALQRWYAASDAERQRREVREARELVWSSGAIEVTAINDPAPRMLPVPQFVRSL